MTGGGRPRQPARRVPTSEGERLAEKMLDLLVFVPAGVVVSVAEEFPKLAALGRERLGVPVSSARSVGELAVRFGEKEIRRLSEHTPLAPRGSRHGPKPSGQPPRRGSRAVTPESTRVAPVAPTPGAEPSAPTAGPSAATKSGNVFRRPNPGDPRAPRVVNGNVPDASALAIPGFDTLSAPQVVQRLDGLSREELVSVRAYEISTRGRRTILNRVDQLLEERA